MQQDDFDSSATNAESREEFEKVIQEGTRIACSSRDFGDALQRFLATYPTQAEATDAAVQRARRFVLFREIWRRVPRPDNGFRPLPLPKLERNESCPCGSGKKYKQCCGRQDAAVAHETENMSLLRYVLDDIPVADYGKLPFHQLQSDEVAFTARLWMEEDRADQARLLLEALFASAKKLDARHEGAFDALVDAYLQLGMTEQRAELTERLMQSSDTSLRSAATVCRCTMHIDAGEWADAWRCFAEAERLQPNNPVLAHLEPLMLATEGRVEEAQKRARHWLARLKKLGYDTDEGGEDRDSPLIEFLHMMSQDPGAVLALIRGDTLDDSDDLGESEWLVSLVGTFDTVTEPVCHYALRPFKGNAGPLMADAELAAVEARWREDYPPTLREEPEPEDWTAWLGEHPLGWQSFAILNDIMGLLEIAPLPEGFGDTFEELGVDILAHAISLLELVIARNSAQGCKLEWCYPVNQPALRLLERSVTTLDDINEEQRLLEWAVGTLNPSDNQGLRESLARIYFELACPADALALCERYPDDKLVAMPYARVLALHQLGRLDDATEALAVARAKHPQVVATLVAEDPPTPDFDIESETIDEDEDAWCYRMDWLYLWTDLGALAWLRQQSPA